MGGAVAVVSGKPTMKTVYLHCIILDLVLQQHFYLALMLNFQHAISGHFMRLTGLLERSMPYISQLKEQVIRQKLKNFCLAVLFHSRTRLLAMTERCILQREEEKKVQNCIE